MIRFMTSCANSAEQLSVLWLRAATQIVSAWLQSPSSHQTTFKLVFKKNISAALH
jgi:hypothetical protein